MLSDRRKKMCDIPTNHTIQITHHKVPTTCVAVTVANVRSAVSTLIRFLDLVHSRDLPHVFLCVFTVHGVLLHIVSPSPCHQKAQRVDMDFRTIYSTALKNTYQLNELKIGLAYL